MPKKHDAKYFQDRRARLKKEAEASGIIKRPPKSSAERKREQRAREKSRLERLKLIQMALNDKSEISEHPSSLIPELCKWMYNQGWATGTGGGLSMRLQDTIFVAPSGVQKERIQPSDLFQLNPQGEIITPPTNKTHRMSQCTPLFMLAYTKRKAGCVLHSHSMTTVLATTLFKGNEFRCKNLEMIKGVPNQVKGCNYRFDEELIIPIVENTCEEADLADSMAEAMDKYPAAPAVLVRRHGIYVWGDTWQKAKTTAECIDYLLDITVRLHSLPKSDD